MQWINVYLLDELPLEIQKDAYDENFELILEEDPDMEQSFENFKKVMRKRKRYFTSTGRLVLLSDFHGVRPNPVHEENEAYSPDKGEWFIVEVRRHVEQDVRFTVFARDEEEAKKLVKEGKGTIDPWTDEVEASFDYDSMVVIEEVELGGED